MHTVSTYTDHCDVLGAEQLGSVASEAAFKIDVMSEGTGVTRTRHMRDPGGWSLDVTDLGSHVRASGGLNAGTVAVLAVQRASEATICGTPMQQDVVVIIPGGTQITASILPGLSYVTVVLPMSRWLDLEAETTGRDPRSLGGPVAFRLPSEQSRKLPGLAQNIAASVASGGRHGETMPAPLGSYLSSVAEALAVAEDRAPVANRGRHHNIQLAGAAQDYIEAHFDEAITIGHLCRELGTSRRQLEYAFRSVFAVAPRDFVERVRLNECRRRLKSCRDDGSSITRIAMDAGFSHMSRFSASYRKLFGELPSVTLRS